MAEQAADHVEQIPEMLFIIADQDHMVRDNEAFRKLLKEKGYRCEFRVYPGEHTWGFWDSHVQECIDWL